MKKILVINTPSRDKTINRDMAGGLGFSGGEGVVLPPLDLLILATTLKKNRWKVKFVDGVAEQIDDFDYYVKLIDKEKFDFVLGNLSLPTLDDDCRFYRKLKDRFKQIKIILKTGINYKEILTRAIKSSGVNLIIFCECDLNIAKYLVDKERAGSIYVEEGKVVMKLQTKVLIDDLDTLPMPDRDLSEKSVYKYSLLAGVSTTMQTSRGCPYPCGYYCPYPLVQGTRWRHMSAGRIVAEMEDIKRRGINNILFRDATFTLGMERTREMCELLIKKKLNMVWWCETRINVLNADLLKLMKAAGCVGINVGVETLNAELILSEGKPGVSLPDVIKLRKEAKKCGMKLHFLMIVGLPNDNLEGLYGSLKYLLQLQPESLGVTSITPYPGTKLFDDAKAKGMISNFDWNNFNGGNSNMKTKYLGVAEIEFARKLIMAGVLFNGKSGLVKTLGVALVKGVFEGWMFIKNK